jgi:hypothetical protein
LATARSRRRRSTLRSHRAGSETSGGIDHADAGGEIQRSGRERPSGQETSSLAHAQFSSFGGHPKRRAHARCSFRLSPRASTSDRCSPTAARVSPYRETTNHVLNVAGDCLARVVSDIGEPYPSIGGFELDCFSRFQVAFHTLRRGSGPSSHVDSRAHTNPLQKRRSCDFFTTNEPPYLIRLAILAYRPVVGGGE